jgi:hypothetical protein
MSPKVFCMNNIKGTINQNFRHTIPVVLRHSSGLECYLPPTRLPISRRPSCRRFPLFDTIDVHQGTTQNMLRRRGCNLVPECILFFHPNP